MKKDKSAMQDAAEKMAKVSQQIRKQDILGEGVEGQKLLCRPLGDVEDRFWRCELDGREIPLPTDRIKVELDKDDQIISERNTFAINLVTSFRTDEPRIHVECGFHREQSESPDVDEFCVLRVRDAEE